MAQPVNTFDTVDAVGIREDLRDVIYDYSPYETPFYSRCKKSSASNTFHEWQEDELRASAVNAHVEGDDVVPNAITPTVRKGNYCQRFEESAVVSGTVEAVKKAGRNSEMMRAILRKTRVLKKDIEKAIFSNTARDAGSSTTARYLAGAGAWVATNTANVGSGGSDPTGDGTDARTDGTETALTQADFNTVMKRCWDNGGTPDTVYLSSNQMNVALGFTGNNNQRATIVASRGTNTVVNDVDVYVTPWGTVQFVMSRECRDQDVWVMQSDTWEIASLRTLTQKPLAKTGDSEKRFMTTELTLVCRSEKVNGLVADCS